MIDAAALHPPLRQPAFEHLLRVYWEDTDAGGVVFYANHLKFFERARTEWLRSLGFGQQKLLDETGLMFVVSDTQLRYLRPARLDDLLRITVHLQEAGRASLVLRQQAFRAEELLVEGDIRIGCVEQRNFRPQRIPTSIAALLAQGPA